MGGIGWVGYLQAGVGIEHLSLLITPPSPPTPAACDRIEQWLVGYYLMSPSSKVHGKVKDVDPLGFSVWR